MTDDVTGDRQRVFSGSPWEAEVGYCRAVRVGRHVYVAGTAPQWPDGRVDPDIEVQVRRCFEIIAAALAEVGGSLDDVVRTRAYLVDAADLPAFRKVHGELMTTARPACTGIVVQALLDPAWRIEIEVDAVLPSPG
jgi:enamine deaminase RidA (YjgF/YER057c/UK114 family)